MTHKSFAELEELAVIRSRVRGCLLGGALGDALGNPVEFQSLAQIRTTYGEAGIVEPVADTEGVVGRITDDTQMTLFTTEGLIRARVRAIVKEATAGQETFFVHDAYLRWLETQEHNGPQPARHEHDRIRSGWLRQQTLLYARRAPGNACLTGLRHEYIPYPDTELDGSPGPVNPDSKGCGTVMRSAPFGLTDFTPNRAFTVAANCARMTHGHPTGYYAAGAFAALIAHLRQGRSLAKATLTVLNQLAEHRGSNEVIAALTRACDLAEEGRPTAEKVELLGAGWVAEEALAIAVYCAIVGDSVRASLLLAANHSGDSDSTAAICGNLLGARYGDVALPTDWLAVVEGRGLISEIADDLDTRFHSDDDPQRLWTGPAQERYGM